jgi:hypothetical protein
VVLPLTLTQHSELRRLGAPIVYRIGIQLFEPALKGLRLGYDDEFHWFLCMPGWAYQSLHLHNILNIT